MSTSAREIFFKKLDLPTFGYPHLVVTSLARRLNIDTHLFVKIKTVVIITGEVGILAYCDRVSKAFKIGKHIYYNTYL